MQSRKVYSIPMAEWVILKILRSTSRVSISLRPRQTADGISGDLRELYGKSAVIVGYGDVGGKLQSD